MHEASLGAAERSRAATEDCAVTITERLDGGDLRSGKRRGLETRAEQRVFVTGLGEFIATLIMSLWLFNGAWLVQAT